jgi:hypothetical protein
MKGTSLMSDPLVEQLSSIDSIEAADQAVLTLAAEILEAKGNQRRKNLREIRRVIQHAIKENLLPARDFDQRLDDLHIAIMEEAFGIIKPHLPNKVWEELRELFEGAFNKARLREGLRK